MILFRQGYTISLPAVMTEFGGLSLMCGLGLCSLGLWLRLGLGLMSVFELGLVSCYGQIRVRVRLRIKCRVRGTTVHRQSLPA